MKDWVKIAVPAAAIIILGLLCWPVTAPTEPSSAFVTQVTQALETSSYVEVEAVDLPILPDTLEWIAPAVEESVHISGTWSPDTILTPEDTLDVEVSTIEVGNTQWAQVSINGKPALIYDATWFEKKRTPGRLAAGLEVVIIPDFDIGAIVSYRVFTLWEINVEAAVAIDINETITDSPDWLALGGRLSKRFWRSVELGADIGIHITEEETCTHFGTGLTVRF